MDDITWSATTNNLTTITTTLLVRCIRMKIREKQTTVVGTWLPFVVWVGVILLVLHHQLIIERTLSEVAVAHNKREPFPGMKMGPLGP